MGCLEVKESTSGPSGSDTPSNIINSEQVEDSQGNAVIIGGKGVGKSCFINRLFYGEWSENVQSQETIFSLINSGNANKLITKNTSLDVEQWKKTPKYSISEKIPSDKDLKIEYYIRGIRILILAYNTSNLDSFLEVTNLLRKIYDLLLQQTYYTKLPKYLIGLQSDTSQTATQENVQQWLDEIIKKEREELKVSSNFEWKHFVVSAKDGKNVDSFSEDFISSLLLFF